MAYFAPFIDPVAGLVIPSYQDILQDLITNFRTVYGQTVYLGTDSADYQMLSIFALKTYDTFLAVQLSYNARSITTAVGSDLDAIAKLVPGTRKAASFSSVPLQIIGAPGTTINGGSAIDPQGNEWALPLTVTIPSFGSVVVTGISTTAGAIQAAENTINQIGAGATLGWTGVTNPSPASPGLPVETDSQFRGRLFLAVALPSITPLQATKAAIAAVAGVSRYLVHENFTSATDGDGTPPHSISAVVEGGTNLDIATAINLKKTIGADTYGGGSPVVVPITDADGSITDISFARPTVVNIFVSLTIVQLDNYSGAAALAIVASLVTYLNSLQIGQSVTLSALYAVAMSVMPSVLTPEFAIEALTLGTAAAPTGTADIAIAYNEVAATVSGNIVLTGG